MAAWFLIYFGVFSFASSRSLLSSFRSEKIVGKSLSNDIAERIDQSVLSEAILILRSHFIKRHLYKDDDWVRWHKELSSYYSDPHQAIRALLSKFNDPYTRFIDIKTMKKWKQSLKGVTVGVGVIVRRRWHFEDLGIALRAAINPAFINAFDRQESASKIFIPANSNRKRISTIVWRKLIDFFDRKTNTDETIDNQGISPIPLSKLGSNSTSTFQWQRRMWACTKLFVYSAIICHTAPFHFKDPKAVCLVFLGTTVCVMVLSNLRTTVSPILFPLEVVGKESCGATSKGLQVPFSNDAIMNGDRLLYVDGLDVRDRSVRDVRRMLNKGTVGEAVIVRALRIIREKQLQSNGRTREQKEKFVFEVALWRDYILKRKLDFRLLPSCGKGVGYIAIKEFTDESFREVTEALSSLRGDLQSRNQALQGLVVDLRGNPGGALASALDIASLFLQKGSTLLHMGLDSGKIEREISKNRKPIKDVSLLLLTDGQTASASEILAEALCENKRATSMGSRTVGKNVAQAVMTLSDGSGLSFTIREYFSPSGRYMGGGHVPTTEVAGPLDISELSFNESTRSWTLAHSAQHYIFS